MVLYSLYKSTYRQSSKRIPALCILFSSSLLKSKISMIFILKNFVSLLPLTNKSANQPQKPKAYSFRVCGWFAFCVDERSESHQRPGAFINLLSYFTMIFSLSTTLQTIRPLLRVNCPAVLIPISSPSVTAVVRMPSKYGRSR